MLRVESMIDSISTDITSKQEKRNENVKRMRKETEKYQTDNKGRQRGDHQN
jgi:hypothetical protein